MTGVTRAAIVVLLGSALAMPAGSQARVDRSGAARSGAAWLVSRQEPDGTLPTYGGSGVGEVLVSLLVGGVRGEPVEAALDFIRKDGPAAASGPAKAARIAMGLVAASEDPRSFHSTNYVARIDDGYDATTGAYEENVYADALAALGIVASGDNLPGRAITYLKTNQCATGGWAWRQACAGLPDVDTTAMVMSALLASGLPKSDDAISRGRSWLVDAQNDDGGFPLEDGGETNANSTGLALSVIESMDEDPAKDPWRNASGDPVQVLIELQHESGGFRFKTSDSKPGDYATVQAVPGLAGATYPVTAVALGSEGMPPAPGDVAVASDAPVVAPSDQPDDEHGEKLAGVIIMNGRRPDRTFCVTFEEPTITGEQLLERTGAEVVESRTQMGAAVCKIGTRGCPAGDCFCKFPIYWNYWTLDAGSKTWKYSDVGAAMRTVDDGAIDAWVWGTGKETKPPSMTVNEICSAVSAPGTAGTPEAETTPAAGTLWPFLGAALAFVVGGFAVWWRVRTP